MRQIKIILASAAVIVTWSLATPWAQAANYLIKNATLHTATAKGTLKQADLLVENGKIIRVGQQLAVPADVEIIDASNKHITPGLINAYTSLGLVEIGAVAVTNDSATSAEGFGASFNIAPAINFRSTLIPQNRINGLTRAIVMPRVGTSLFAGEASAITLESTMDGLISDNVAQLAMYGDAGAGQAGGSRAAAFQMLDKALTESAYLKKNESRYLPGFNWNFSQSLDDLKALFKVVSGKSPLIVRANRGDDILRLIALAKKHRAKLVIAGGAEAWTVAAELAAAKVPVIIDPIMNLPQFEALSVRLDGAARLYQAGVKLLFTGGGSHNAYLLRQSAGNAVAYGLPADAAIEAMTINTAEVFSIKNYGQLKAGMDADLVIWDTDPLEISATPDQVFIRGDRQPMVSRATRLSDRYWDNNSRIGAPQE